MQWTSPYYSIKYEVQTQWHTLGMDTDVGLHRYRDKKRIRYVFICFMCTDQGCSYQPNITLPYIDNNVNDIYRFRVQISCAEACHCVAIGNTSQPYGDRIRDHWSKVWAYNEATLCGDSNPQQMREHYSNGFLFSVDNDQIELSGISAGGDVIQCSTDILSSLLEEELQSKGCLSSTADSMPTTTPFFTSTPLLPNTSPVMSTDNVFSSTAQVSFTPSSTVHHISTTVGNPTSSTISPSSTAELSSTIMPSTFSTDYSSSTSSDSSVSPSSTAGVSTPAFHITSSQISVSPTPSVYCPAEQGVWNQTLMCEESRIVSVCPNIPITNG